MRSMFRVHMRSCRSSRKPISSNLTIHIGILLHCDSTNRSALQWLLDSSSLLNRVPHAASIVWHLNEIYVALKTADCSSVVSLILHIASCFVPRNSLFSQSACQYNCSVNLFLSFLYYIFSVIR